MLAPDNRDIGISDGLDDQVVQGLDAPAEPDETLENVIDFVGAHALWGQNRLTATLFGIVTVTPPCLGGSCLPPTQS